MSTIDDGGNFESFTDCLSGSIIAKLASSKNQKSDKRSRRKRRSIPMDHGCLADDDLETGDLSEFVEYLAEEIFSALPDDLKHICYAAVQDDKDLANRYEVPLDAGIQEELVKTLPAALTDSLCAYGLIHEPQDLGRFLEPALSSYITTATEPPPEYTPSLSTSRPTGCEICDREQLPLTYHHLIPRQVHGKAVKRGWHKEWELNKVAWLCRACHSFVHKCASNEELAKDYYDVELLLERDDVQRFASWVGRVRWKAR